MILGCYEIDSTRSWINELSMRRLFIKLIQEVGVNQVLYFLVFGESLLNDAVTGEENEYITYISSLTVF